MENATKMTVKGLTEITFENDYKQIGFTEKNSYYLLKYAKRKTSVIWH